MTGQELQTIRKRLGMTQKEMAFKLEVPRTRLARWEAGIYAISKAFEKKITNTTKKTKTIQKNGVNTISVGGQNSSLGVCRLSLEGRCAIVCQNPTIYPCYRPWRNHALDN